MVRCLIFVSTFQSEREKKQRLLNITLFFLDLIFLLISRPIFPLPYPSCLSYDPQILTLSLFRNFILCPYGQSVTYLLVDLDRCW